MGDNRAANAMRLRAIEATAAVAAHDLEHGRLWPGDLSRMIGQIHEQLQQIDLSGERNR